MIKLAPSLLAADLLHLGQDIQGMLDHGVDQLHFDVMDAHFVPNLSFGPSLCEAVHRTFPRVILDVHLMMDNPEKYLDAFVGAGSSSITVHREIAMEPDTILPIIRKKGVKAGLSLKPGTPAEALIPYLDLMDLALVMTVEPGFGGQKFMPEQVEKIRFLRQSGYRGDIAVDGGVNMENAPLLLEAGANILVMGTAYFRAEDPGRVAQYFKEYA